MRKFLLSGVAVFTLGAICVNLPVRAEGPVAKTSEAQWGYVGTGSAARWGALSEDYHVCAKGEAQSPINIARYLQEDLQELAGAYGDGPLEVVNNGHTVQVNFAEGSGFIVDGEPFDLVQAHFRTPSEHYLDGAPYPMEMQLVHRDVEGRLAVIGVMMKIGAHNPVVEGIWQNVPVVGEVKRVDHVQINASALMPEDQSYYRYDGSLTTPPCSEDVLWHVMQKPIELSEAQLRAFQSVFPVNARPVQPLNGRLITGD